VTQSIAQNVREIDNMGLAQSRLPQRGITADQKSDLGE
jgi:hypothetical protein